MRNRHIYLTLMAILGISMASVAQNAPQNPQLVVSIAIEHLSTDQLEAYFPLYTQDGLKRLLNNGLIYLNGRYSFTPVDHASAMASLVTGSSPYYNGVTGTDWLNRNTLRPQNIVEDKEKGISPVQMLTSTIGDELKIATDGQSKIFAFSNNQECAILSAGHAADGAIWISQGKWQIASYYQPTNQWISWYTRQYNPTEDINRSITDIALRCVEQSGIGQDDKTDLLYISYSIHPDAVGYQLLDRNIANLINGIHRKLPSDRVLFVLTGLGTKEEEREGENERYHIPTGKFFINRTANLLNMYLGAVYGSAQYVETCHKNQIFLNRKLIDKKNLNHKEMLSQAQEFLLQVSGVRNVYTSTQLITSDSPLLQRIHNGFNVEKCGDLLIEVAPGWQLVNEETNYTNTSRSSNIQIPIIFYGTNVKADRIQTPITIDRIAPTLARCIHIRAPNACEAEPLF